MTCSDRRVPKGWLHYEVVSSSDSHLAEGRRGRRVFSLLIVHTTDLFGVKHAFLYDVARKKCKAEKLIRLLADNLVTPEELPLLAEELVSLSEEAKPMQKKGLKRKR